MSGVNDFVCTQHGLDQIKCPICPGHIGVGLVETSGINCAPGPNPQAFSTAARDVTSCEPCAQRRPNDEALRAWTKMEHET